MAAWIALLVLITSGVLLVVRHDAGTIAGFEPSDFAILASSVALLIWLGVSLLPRYRGQLLGAVRDLAAWAGMMLVLVGLYSFREPLYEIARRVTGELLPPGSTLSVETNQAGEKSVRIRRRNQNHFYVRSKVNGADMTMLVDTGASTVVLRPADAKLAGVDLSRLSYSVPVSTANGTAYAARVKLATITVGIISFNNIEALVVQPGALKESLLGMTFLSRLRSYEFSGDFLTLRG